MVGGVYWCRLYSRSGEVGEGIEGGSRTKVGPSVDTGCFNHSRPLMICLTDFSRLRVQKWK